MKIYFHLNPGGFSNCYVVVNEETSQALIIDPGQITEEIISQIEDNHLSLDAVLVTHNHGSHVHGLKTLQKIYTAKIFAADWNVAPEQTTVLTGDGKFQAAGLNIRYMSIPGHTFDSLVFCIGNVMFSGDVLSAGFIGSTNSSYSEFILKSNIEQKIFSQVDRIVLMPGHGPPSTLEAIKAFNQNF